MEMITDGNCNQCGLEVTPGEHSGHNAHFTGAWYCHDCGALCVREDDPEMERLALLEEPAPHCESVAGLYSWSENCEHPTPFAVFFDLIGESEEIFGESICGNVTVAEIARRFGYMELSHLANALDDYATRPNEIRDYARALVETELRP